MSSYDNLGMMALNVILLYKNKDIVFARYNSGLLKILKCQTF